MAALTTALRVAAVLGYGAAAAAMLAYFCTAKAIRKVGDLRVDPLLPSKRAAIGSVSKAWAAKHNAAGVADPT